MGKGFFLAFPWLLFWLSPLLPFDWRILILPLMTEKTLENPADAGAYRTNDEVVVEDAITHEVVHTPPSYKDILPFIEDLCIFFNENNTKVFIHPIIKGIIIHFMIAYMHPFVDGNGQTAFKVEYEDRVVFHHRFSIR